MICSPSFQAECFAPQAAGFPVRPLAPGNRRASDCTLQRGQATTLQARRGGMLRIVQGRLWITFSDADTQGRVRAGDHILKAGESLQLSAGDVVVIEAWPEAGGKAPARFRWEPAMADGFMARLTRGGWIAARALARFNRQGQGQGQGPGSIAAPQKH